MLETKVVIIGGGCIGASCLYHLAKKGCTEAVLFEKGTYGNASTGKSAGIIETVYLDEEEINLRVRSMPLFLRFKEEEGLPLETNGYLRLGRSEEDKDLFERGAEIQKKLGAEAKVLSPEEIKDLVPDLDISGIKVGLFGPEAAYIDPYLLTSIFVEKAKEEGANAYQNTEVFDIKVSDSGVYSVVTNKGEFKCDCIINAAGAWAEKIGNMVGVNLPVKGYRRQLVVMDAPGINYTVPSVMDYVPGKEKEGVYFREERGGKIFSGLHWESFGEDEEPVDPDNYNEKVDSDYIEKVAEKLLTTAPGFKNLGVQNGWAGFYPFAPDGKPIIGELEELRGFYNCIGFGGHGVQVSPVFGEIMADLILNGETDIIDVKPYSLNRFKISENPS